VRFTAAPTADFCAELRALGLGEAASGEVAMLEGATWLDDVVVPDPLQQQVPQGAVDEVGSL
jgi:hypothetical protein|tara:strand:+ start:311 stop:496 length:186 start_codon:yes stop_codon:yes gene_type:complete